MSDPNVSALSSEVEALIEEALTALSCERHICDEFCGRLRRSGRQVILRDLVRKALATVERANELLRAKVDSLEARAEVQATYCEDHKRERNEYRLALTSRDRERPSDDVEVKAVRRACREYEAERAELREQARALADAASRHLRLQPHNPNVCMCDEDLRAALASWDTSQKESR